MTPLRILGVIALVVGIVLLVMGVNGSNSVADQLTHTFSGHYTDRTTWYIVGGLALAVVGLAMTLSGIRGRHVT